MASCGLALAMATEQLAVADDALALGADVDQDLVLVDADDLALDDVAVLEALDVGVLLGEQLLHRRRLGSERARRRRLLLVIARGGRVGGLLVGQRVVGGRGPPSLPDGPARCRRQMPPVLAARGRAGSRPRAVVGGRRPWVASSACAVAARSSVLVAGSSATATAATLSSDAWSAAEAMASGSGVVPPCCSSVKGLVTPGGGFAPENHERPERRSGRVRNDQVVRGDRLRGPLLRASNGL